MGRLDDKVAIITGAARGQGAEEARLFSREGATVVLTDVLADDGRAVAEEVGGTFITHDVSTEEGWDRVARQVLDDHGRIDVLVNNAGVFNRVKMLDTTLDEFQRMMDINVVGVFLGMKAVAPAMRTQGRGSIINISSVAGLLASPGAFAYGASKFAVRGMTKTAAIELSRHGVRVNSIHPGLIQTAMLDQVFEGAESRREAMIGTVPLGETADAAAIAYMALFLASDESAYATGAEFVIDGGVTAI